MAYKIIEQGRKPNTIWQTFICDAEDDVATLPTDCPAGSRAIVADGGDLYLLDTQGVWHKMPRGGGGGGGGSDVVVNPVLEGNEERLDGIEVGGVKYANPKEIEYIEYSTLQLISYQQIRDTYNAGKLPVLIDSLNNFAYPLKAAGTSFFLPPYSFINVDSTNGTVTIYTVGYYDSQTRWDTTTFANTQVLLLQYGESEITYDDLVSVFQGQKIPVLADMSTGDYMSGVFNDSDGKIAFEKLDFGSGKYIRYSYLLGDPDPWSTFEMPIGEISNLFCTPNTTSFYDIVSSVQMGRQPLINDIANGRTYYVSGYTLSGGDPVAIRFCTLEKDDSGLRYTWTVDYQDTWTSSTEYDSGIYYVEPNSTQFMDIVNVLQNKVIPVINDMANGRAYYISDYTIVGGQPAAITFSTIGANTPHTWTVDYQDNWTST